MNPARVDGVMIGAVNNVHSATRTGCLFRVFAPAQWCACARLVLGGLLTFDLAKMCDLRYKNLLFPESA